MTVEEGNWLKWQLADSALPTGGFVTSSGLEVAYQQGWMGDGIMHDVIIHIVH
jgi:urease accessory protein UreF